MLTQLHIRNLAIIDELALDFYDGMTVLTGETGAGKSILIDALGLILGDRGDTSIIREGCEKSEIVATFIISDYVGIQEILDAQSISCNDQELIIRRIINRDGRSKAYVNSSMVPVQVLRNIGESLVNIHGQHEHQSLTQRATQRYLLDCYAGHESLLKDLNLACNEWKKVTDQLTGISSDSSAHSSTMELLSYQISELEEPEFQAGEYDELEDEYKRLVNITEIIETTQASLELLSDNELAAENAIQRTINRLRNLQKTDAELEKFANSLENVSIQLTDAVDEIRRYSENLETNPRRLEEVDRRLNLMMDLARKHQVHARDLPEQLISLKVRLEALESSVDSINELIKRQQQISDEYHGLATKLHDSRKKSAKSMAGAIEKHLSGLGMQDGKFEINVAPLEYEQPLSEGADQIEYLVSLNPGSKPLPMRKVASGGELSRLSLAIQLVTKQARMFPTLIFDEIDAGIGGKTADIVGSLLQDLAKHHQVLCVTHLPQVASRGNHHLQVSKSSNANITCTQVEQLDDEARVEEIARMLGGMRVSKKTRDHAREMLAH